MNKYPRYQHDCDKCHSLGPYQEYDLYVCPEGIDPTVIARFGPDGDYLSGLCFADRIPQLGEAKRRAIIQGLLA